MFSAGNQACPEMPNDSVGVGSLLISIFKKLVSLDSHLSPVEREFVYRGYGDFCHEIL